MLGNYLDVNDINDLHNQLIILSGRFTMINSDLLVDLISYDLATIQLNKISMCFISILNTVPDSFFELDLEMPPSQPIVVYFGDQANGKTLAMLSLIHKMTEMKDDDLLI